MEKKHRGKHYLRSSLSVALGAGAALGGSFLLSRIREKQDVESRLDRLEQMLGKVAEAGEETAAKPKKKPAAKRPSRKKPA